MKEKDSLIYLTHILDSINQIISYTSGLDEAEFLNNRMVEDACVRNFEIIGEATKNIGAKFRNKYPEIEWKKMAGTRDKLIHDYIGIDYGIIWTTIEDIIPGLKNDIERIIKIESEG